MPSRALRSFIPLAVLCALSSPLFAQPQTPPRPPAPVYNGQDIAAVNATINRFGFDMVTVGAPGNRSWIRSEWAISGNVIGSTPNHIDDRGRVDYSYRIMRTEVVQTQYVDFLRGFEPFWRSIENIPNSVETGSPTDNSVTGRGISIFGSFDVNHAFDNSAMTISWRNAARYANWLHHGAPTEAAELSWDTFHTGAYTFTEQSFTSTRGSPITRNEDARFWLPGLDEYLKAAYYDPDRYGEGQEGYWPYPNGSEKPPAFGPPGTGDWGYGDDDTSAERLTVGRYPGTVSPWGLLDVVGTAEEWVETPGYIGEFPDGAIVPIDRLIVGRTAVFPGLIDEWAQRGEAGNLGAFRLATIVPAPSGAAPLLLGVLALARRRRAAALASVALSATALAGGGGGGGAANNKHLRLTQEHGFTFTEIGDPGNPGFSYGPPGLPVRTVGAVDHRYRIATTEITNLQWFGFVQAIAPHIGAIGISPAAPQLLGSGIDYLGPDSNGVPVFRLIESTRQYPAEVGWRFAARFTNWLNNGAPTGPDIAFSVFETGAYDASTFTTNADGTYNDQVAHNQDARYWIPTQDEWHKAGYWDPNRYGEGESGGGGWWLYPNATDDTMVVGVPEEGGQTNFGANFVDMPNLPQDVGSYPEELSPWGLLDVSGGMREWTDDVVPLTNKERYIAGTRAFQLEGPTNYGDRLGWNFNQSFPPLFPVGTLRVAAAIPSPSVPAILSLGMLLAARRRR